MTTSASHTSAGRPTGDANLAALVAGIPRDDRSAQAAEKTAKIAVAVLSAAAKDGRTDFADNGRCTVAVDYDYPSTKAVDAGGRVLQEIPALHPRLNYVMVFVGDQWRYETNQAPTP